jgi:response regulator of citrate/malate metabolism
MIYCINCKNTKSNRENIEGLKETLDKIYNNSGLTIRLEYDNDNITVAFSINEYKAQRSTTRNAGRHKAYTKYKCKDIEKLQKQGLTVDEIAEKLEMSRCTYYRHLKRMNEHKDMDRYF